MVTRNSGALPFCAEVVAIKFALDWAELMRGTVSTIISLGLKWPSPGCGMPRTTGSYGKWEKSIPQNVTHV